jgi:hypothetical protein
VSGAGPVRRDGAARRIARGANAMSMALVALASLGSARVLGAQSGAPWAVTVKPTMNPLPIGTCGAVWVTLLDASGKDTPRSPTGQYITIADFDLSVRSKNPLAVVGKYSGASSYSVCACQHAKAGDSATVTATYPAKALATKSQVPGVKFSKSAAFVIKRRVGSFDAPGCSDLKKASAASTR